MKILNAKGLQRFASSGGFPDKEGYLLKRGDLNKGFQKRWFLLRGNLLFYSEKRGDKEPAGVIILEGCSIEIADCEQVDNYAFQITFPGSATRNYVLSASSQEDLESWMKALSCASYDYVRLLVAELENQLQEAVAADNAKLIQDAERDSRLFSHTYSIDAGATAGHDQRTHPPAGITK
ncbi:sesquipedalian-1-like [Babylonia areolata]|uniref:sesquipedalian-1-like n=1 Tax=Babylonia areolata TaxID=304850 RepID=UPI003FD206FE